MLTMVKQVVAYSSCMSTTELSPLPVIPGLAPEPEHLVPSLPEVHDSVRLSRSPFYWRRLLGFLGPGFLISVGYMDPGNWATDIAGGSRFGYTLLFGHHALQPDGHSAAKPLAQAGRGHRARSGAAVPPEPTARASASRSGSAPKSPSPPATWPKSSARPSRWNCSSTFRSSMACSSPAWMCC